MKPKFVNQYDFTFKLCREWARHPIDRKQRRKRKKFFYIYAIVIIIYILIKIIKVINKEPLDIQSDFFTPALSLFVIFLIRIIFLRRWYNSWLKSQKQKNAALTYSFADNILIESSKGKAEHEYSEIVQIKDNKDYFYLYLSFDYALRIRKDSFIVGSADEFKEFINSVKSQ